MSRYIYIVSACFFIYNLYKLYIPEPFNMGRLDAVFKGLRTGLETCADEKIRTFLLSLPFAAGLCIYISTEETIILTQPTIFPQPPPFRTHISTPPSLHARCWQCSADFEQRCRWRSFGLSHRCNAVVYPNNHETNGHFGSIQEFDHWISTLLVMHYIWTQLNIHMNISYRFCWCQVAETN